jgi:hypothetical protein
MNFEITDKTVYKTTNWIIESDDDVFYITCQEDDIMDEWIIRSEMKDVITSIEYPELMEKLVDMCINDNSEMSDY